MTQKKEHRGFSTFGFSTILLTFVMIAVVIFSALSLVTAYSDYKLSNKVAENTKGYYIAETKANEKLATLDQILANCYFSSTDKDAYYSELAQLLTDIGTLDTTNYTLSFQEPIGEKQYFQVSLQLKYPSNEEDTFYEIIEWITISIAETFEEEPLNLIH